MHLCVQRVIKKGKTRIDQAYGGYDILFSLAPDVLSILIDQALNRKKIIQAHQSHDNYRDQHHRYEEIDKERSASGAFGGIRRHISNSRALIFRFITRNGCMLWI